MEENITCIPVIQGKSNSAVGDSDQKVKKVSPAAAAVEDEEDTLDLDDTNAL